METEEKSLCCRVSSEIPEDNCNERPFSTLQLYQKATPTQVLSCEICEFFKNTYFEEHLRTTDCLSHFKVVGTVGARGALGPPPPPPPPPQYFSAKLKCPFSTIM